MKKHIQENKWFYSGVATGLGIAVITTLIMRSNIARGTMGVDGLRGGPINTASYGRYETLANSGVYGSKTADTSITMRPISFLSKHLNGKLDNVNGLHFERVSLGE